MKKKFTDTILSYTADAALDAFLASMNIPSLGGSYEPKRTDEMKAYKEAHPSKIEWLFAKAEK